VGWSGERRTGAGLGHRLRHDGLDPGGRVYVDGIGVAWFTANTSRPDVGAAYPVYGNGHGYDFRIPTTLGTHHVCVYAINHGPGDNPLLGCRTITITGNPFGALDSVTPSLNRLRVRGWAIDPDTSTPIQVAVYLDGKGLAWFPANRIRFDVAAAYPDYRNDHGYDFTIPAPSGTHRVCIYGINLGPGNNALLACHNSVA
jgi:hypothetical protein